MITIDNIATKEEVLKNLQDRLNRNLDRKICYTRLAQVLTKYDGKRITKLIEKELQRVMPPSWDVYFTRDLPFLKITLRKRYGSKEVFKEVVTVHHDAWGQNFSLERFLECDNRTAYVTSEVMRLQTLIKNLDVEYEVMKSALNRVLHAHAQFVNDASPVHHLAEFFDEGVHDYIREMHLLYK